MELSPEVRRELDRIQNQLQETGARVRWVPPANIHLTLKFMGAVEMELVPELVETTKQCVVGLAPWVTEVQGVGSFPSGRSPRVIWVGVTDEEGKLARIHKCLDRELRGFSVKREARRYHPHLTLGRVQSSSYALAEAIRSLEETEAGTLTINGLTLFQSDLTPEGAVYTPLAHMPFEIDKENTPV